MESFLLPILLIASLPAIFAIVGSIFLHLKKDLSYFYLPTLGFSSIIVLAGGISTILRISTPLAIYSAILILSLTIMILEIRRPIIEFRRFFQHTTFISITSSMVCAFFSLSKSKYGSLNYDFIWNLNDSFYLEHHTMSQVKIVNNSLQLLPFTWSSNEYSRYGVSYLFASLDSISYRPLVWSFAIYCIMLGLLFYSFAGLARLLFQANNIKILMFSLAAFFSPLNILGAGYEAIGQISALPLVFFILYISYRIIFSNRIELSYFLIYAILCFGLIWLYSALLLVILPIIILVIITIAFKYRNIVAFSKIPVFYMILVFLSLELFVNFHFIYMKFVQLVAVSTSNTSLAASGATIFNQFTSFFGPGISFGFLPYPFRGSVFVGLIGTFATTSLISFFVYIWYREQREFRKFFISAPLFFLAYISFLYISTLFILQSNYSILKINLWFTPIFIPILCMHIFLNSHNLDLHCGAVFRWLFVFVCMSLSITSVSYLDNIWNGHDKNFRYTEDSGKKQLIQFLAIKKFDSVFFSSPSMEDIAWIAMGLPNSVLNRVYRLGSAQQVLAIAVKDGCYPAESVKADSLIVVDKSASDVLPAPTFSGAPIWHFGSYMIYTSRQLTSAWSINGGTYYTEPASFGYPSKDFLIRWTSGKFCIARWSNKTDLTTVKIDFASGPDLNSYPSFVINGKIFGSGAGTRDFKITSHKVLLHPGWNYIKVINKAIVKSISPHSPRPDSRILAYAVKSIS